MMRGTSQIADSQLSWVNQNNGKDDWNAALTGRPGQQSKCCSWFLLILLESCIILSIALKN